MKCLSAISALLIVFNVDAYYFPSYIVPCRQSDPKFKECALEHGQNAIKDIVKGDKRLKMRPLDPLEIPLIDIDPNGQLKIVLMNSTLHGLAKMELRDLGIDVKEQTMSLNFYCPRFDIEGTYNVSGQILILPIKGFGRLEATLFDAEVGYSFEYDLVKRDGATYVDPHPPVVTLEASRSTFHLDNLFNGDKRLGDEMNKFLNENYEVMFKELSPSVRETISAIAQDIVQKIITGIPYESVLLP